MKHIWDYRRLELVTWSVFAILVTTSILMLYSSYKDYHTIVSAVNSTTEDIIAYKLIMLVSSIILIISLLILYTKRDYFFLRGTNDKKILEELIASIQEFSDKNRIKKFKSTLKKKDHKEIYRLLYKMIEELYNGKKMAEEANKTKGLFLSNMAYEIRTPLNGIIGFSKILKSTKLDHEQIDFVNTIRRSSEDLIEMLENILQISKLESGRIEVENSYFNIIDELENLIETYAIEASKKGIDFAIWLDPQLANILVESDSGKIKQILINLISSAIEFTDDGGKISLSIEKVSIKYDDVEVKFTIHDDSIEKQNIFMEIDKGDMMVYDGTTLGLTISLSLIQILGGEIDLEGGEGKGTTISFSLKMPQRTIITEYNYKTMSVAIYAPENVKIRDADRHIEKYLQSFKDITTRRFQTFVECQNAETKSFDVLYIHYDEIDKKELQRIVARHSSDSQVILVTKLKNRDITLDIAPIFSQVIYEPISLSKIKKSIELSSKNKKERIDTNSHSFHGLKALVVEDNPINLKMIIKTLENLGIKSDSAENGKIGVEMYKKNRYNIIFMDIQMPIMNGVDATRMIIDYEKKNNMPHTPIIAVTTNSLKGDRERYLASGMDEYIPKPIDLKKFIMVLKQFYTTKQKEVVEDKNNSEKDILLYKQTPTESKIVGAILGKFGYTVDVAKNIDEFKNMIDVNRYRTLLLDRSDNETTHNSVTDVIKAKSVPTLLFVDNTNKKLLNNNDKKTYSFIIDKSSNFNYIKDKIDEMVNNKN